MKNEVNMDSDSDLKPQTACFLKIKFRNKVKKLSSVPEKFARLDKIIRKKYDEFKEGKKSYTLCYVDEENELINISDEEDYSVYKDFVTDRRISTPKVYLTHRGEENKFEILNNKTICESHLLDETSKFSEIGRSISLAESIIPASGIASSKAMDLLEEMQRQMRLLVEKEQQTQALKQAKKKIKENKKAEKLQKKNNKEQKKKDRSKEQKAKKKTSKDKLKKENESKPQTEIKDIPVVIDVKLEEKHIQNQPINTDLIAAKIAEEQLKKSENAPKVVEIIEPVLNPENNNQSLIQPILQNEQNIPQEEISPEKDQEVELKPFGLLCCQWKRQLKGEVIYLCSQCSDVVLWERCEAVSPHEHCFIKVPANLVFKTEDLVPFYNNLLSSYSDVIAKLMLTPKAVINEAKDCHSPEASKLNQMMAKCLNIDKYKDGVQVQSRELVALSWEVKNFTNNNWSPAVVVSCLPCSDVTIDDMFANVILNKGEKDNLTIEFYTPDCFGDKRELVVYFALFNDDTQIGDIFKAKLILTE